MQPDQVTQLRQLESQLAAEYQTILSKKLNLDLTRGKPSSDQLDLSDALDGILPLAKDGAEIIAHRPESIAHRTEID